MRRATQSNKLFQGWKGQTRGGRYQAPQKDRREAQNRTNEKSGKKEVHGTTEGYLEDRYEDKAKAGETETQGREKVDETHEEAEGLKKLSCFGNTNWTTGCTTSSRLYPWSQRNSANGHQHSSSSTTEVKRTLVPVVRVSEVRKFHINYFSG